MDTANPNKPRVAPVEPADGDHTGGNDVVIDVRPLIERGEEPFGTIMEAVGTLDGRALVVVAPFEPVPLQGVLSAQGFHYASEQVGETEWRVRFEPGATSTADPSPATGPGPSGVAPPGPADTGTVTGTGTDTDAEAEVSPFTIRRPPSTTGTASGAAPTPPTPGAAPAGPAAMMAMNPTANVPPAWLPLGFMAAAGVGLIGFGVAAATTAPTVVTFPRSDEVIATVHLAVLAFLSTAVLGALHQFGPVVGARPLRSVPVGALTGVLFVPGAWAIPIGFATGHVGVIQTGGVLATAAVVLAAWNLSRPLSAPDKGAPIVGLRMAVIYLVATAAFGVTYAFDRSNFWFELLSHRVLAHAHLGLIGWLGLAYVSVAEKLWPMFLLAHRPHVRAGVRAVWSVGLGAPVLTVGLLWPSELLSIVGGALVLAGLVSHLTSLAQVIHHRRRGLELLHGYVLGAAACLVVAMVLGVVAGLAPVGVEVRTRLTAAEVVALILWLALAVLGHSHKIVPFISWNRLRDRGIRTGRDGKPLLFAHLVDKRASQVTFGLALLGAAAALGGVLGSTTVIVRGAGALLALAGLVAIANLVSGPLLMIRWHDRRPDQSDGSGRPAEVSS